MEENRIVSAQWLRFFFYGEIGCFVLSLLHYLPFDTNWISWPRRLLIVGMIVCLFRLVPLNARYKKAAIFRSVQLIATLINVALGAYALHQLATSDDIVGSNLIKILSSVIGLVAMVTSWVATYQLYHSHAEAIEDQDPVLAKKWKKLFLTGLCVVLLTSTISGIITAVMIVLEIGTNTIVSILQTIIGLADDVVTVVGIWYLYRTIRILERQEV